MPPIADNLNLRVILAGRTGLESTLRRDPGIELIRARTPLDALGELADPIDADSPHHTAVILDPDLAADPAATLELQQAIKVIQPSAITLLATSNTHTNGHSTSNLDGTIPPGTDGPTLRALLAKLTTPPTPTPQAPPPFYSTIGRITQQVVFANQASPAPTSAPPPTTIPSITTTPAARAWPATPTSAPEPHRPTTPGTWSFGDDRQILQALLDDQDILPLALDAIRRRVARADVMFIPAPDTTTTPRPTHGVPVVLQGVAPALLASPTLEAHHLEHAAPWLAHWLTLQATLRKARQDSITDELTGAYNRRYLDRFLDAAIRESATKRHMLTVMVLDIDNFKTFNDRFGHPAGDEILVQIIKLLRSVIRPDDRVCRIGGDEFVVVFYEPAGPRELGSRHPQSVQLIAERFRKQIADARFPKLGTEAAGALTVSAGLATFPWDGLTGPDLLKAADANLYHSKDAGKNTINLGNE